MQKPKEKRKGEKDMEKLIEEEMGRGGGEKEKASLTFMFAARVVRESEVKRD